MNQKPQGRLMTLAALVLCLYALGLSLAATVQERNLQAALSWDHWLGVAAWVFIFALAYKQTRQHLPESDPYILPIIALLTGWGMLTVWRLTPGFGMRQALWVLVAGVIFIIGLRVSKILSLLYRYKYILLTSGLLLTALTLVFGTNPVGNGPRLWLGCCGVYFQPSEPLKLLLVIYLAAYLADRPSAQLLRTPTFLFPIFFLTGTALLLLAVQRDLGTASIFIAIQAFVLYLGTGKKRILLFSALALSLAGILGYFFIDIVRLRLDAWLNPWADPARYGYQIIQSLLAVANGGLVGRGPGLGNPALVPIAHSDFIFVAIAEETGLLGTTILLVLYAVLVMRGFHIAQNAPGRFQRLLAGGLSIYMAVQTVLIVGGNLRLLPLTGVTLPFVSYGGSALLTAFLAGLLLLQISNSSEDAMPAPLATPQPYAILSAILLMALTASMLANGWWAILRGPDLLTRTDNPRRAIADSFVRRGSLLDRKDKGITVTRGETGSFARIYLYPDLAPIAGYTHPTYGQAGLEASLDPYLRGIQGNPASLVWWNHLLYGQPPTGLNVRLSIDLDLQQSADTLLGEHKGALVLVNAANGEILAMASHPTYDPNTLETTGQAILASPDAPLINRAAQGSYTPGTALGPFLLAGTYPQLPDFPQEAFEAMSGCLQPPETKMDWSYAISNGCPDALEMLGRQIGSGGMLNLFDKLGFYTTPRINLQTAAPAARLITVDAGQAAVGLGGLKVSPVQMALATASLSYAGTRPAARLAMAVNTPRQGWVVLPPGDKPVQVYEPGAADASTQSLMVAGQPFWQAGGRSRENGQAVTWYLAGSLPGWQGTPLALVVLLEEDNYILAEHIGQTVLRAALNQK